MHTLVLSTGSNLGSRKNNLESARKQIGERIGRIRLTSALYESRAWGFRSENLFFNQCLEVLTELGPEESLDRILEIERMMGRASESPAYQDRIIDIDILFFDDRVLETDRLKIPHPKLHERKFVLRPLADILPDLRHPGFHVSIQELLERCRDTAEIHPVEGF